MIDCEFTKKSRAIVEGFLQSAVIVDDRAQLDRLAETPGIGSELAVSPPLERPRIGSGGASGEVARIGRTT